MKHFVDEKFEMGLNEWMGLGLNGIKIWGCKIFKSFHSVFTVLTTSQFELQVELLSSCSGTKHQLRVCWTSCLKQPRTDRTETRSPDLFRLWGFGSDPDNCVSAGSILYLLPAAGVLLSPRAETLGCGSIDSTNGTLKLLWSLMLALRRTLTYYFLIV